MVHATKSDNLYDSAILEGVQSVGDKLKQGSAFLDIGDAYYNLGDFRQALCNHELYVSSIGDEDRATVGRAHGILGNDHLGLGNHELALVCFEKQLEIAEETGERAEKGHACENLGHLYFKMANFNLATTWYKCAMYIAEEIGNKTEIGKTKRFLGNCYYRDGRFQNALKYHRKDLKLAKELGDKDGEGVAFGNLGDVYFSLGDFQKAITCHEKSLDIGKETENSAEVGKACYAIGCCLESLGSSDEAERWLRLSKETFDDLRKPIHSNDEWRIDVQDEYKLVIIALRRTLLKQKKTREALLVAEEGRAQALVDLLNHSTSEREIDPDSDRLNSLLSSLSCVTLFFAIEKKNIAIWVLNGNDVQVRESEIDERCRALRPELNLTFNSLVQAAYPLLENEVYSLAKDCALTPEEIRQEREKSMKEALKILYEVVIKPVEDLLTGDEIVIVPDGPLCKAPFTAFIDSSDRYLCESYRIRLVPSLTSFKLIVDSSKFHSQEGALLVGNPNLEEIVTEEPWNWKLPGAEEEVKGIGRILKSEPLIGKDATKEKVLQRLKFASLVHIATQGRDKNGEILLTPNPMRESQEPRMEDYMLTMADVAALQLQARMVVLSCCHSAQGKIKAEGTVGIARGFLAAGARCVLVALWEIDDEVTLELMNCFYKQLVSGKKASEALNHAMKHVWEQQDHDCVKDWAAFQLLGDDVKWDFLVE